LTLAAPLVRVGTLINLAFCLQKKRQADQVYDPKIFLSLTERATAKFILYNELHFPCQMLIFRDLPGLKNKILKFHDFPGFP